MKVSRLNHIRTGQEARILMTLSTEAHMIRRQATLFFKACYDLSAESRWCLTGTPIQNKLEDIGSLFAFIRARPFDAPSIFRQFIVTPYDEGGDRRRIAAERLVQLLDSLCLRRTKERLHLPGRQDKVVEIELSQAERRQYDDTKMMMKNYIQQKAGVYQRHNTFSMFQAVLQLRILCNHGTFQNPHVVGGKMSQRDMREAAVSALGQNSETVCSECKLPMPVLGSNRIQNNFLEHCSHVLCSECLDNICGHSNMTLRDTHCPLCERMGPLFREPKLVKHSDGRLPHRHGVYREGGLYQIIEENDDEYFRMDGFSSKMEALMKDVLDNLWHTKRYSHANISNGTHRELMITALYSHVGRGP